MNIVQRYLRNVAVAIDQLINALAGGEEDETLSSRLGRGRNKGLKVHTVLANLTDWFFKTVLDEDNHCQRNIEKIIKNDAIID